MINQFYILIKLLKSLPTYRLASAVLTTYKRVRLIFNPQRYFFFLISKNFFYLVVLNAGV